MNLLLAAAGTLALALAGVGVLLPFWPAIREVSRTTRLAIGFCVGAWLVTMIFFAAYLAGFSFTRRLIIVPVALLAIAGIAGMIKGPVRISCGAILPVALCVLALMLSWARPVYGYDAVMMWALKAKMMFFSRTWPATMFDPFTTAHTEYPPLVPSAQAYIFFCLGQFDDVASRVVFAAYFASGAAILWWLLERKWIWVVWWCALPAVMEQVKLTYADMPLTVYLLGFYGAIRKENFWLAGLFGGMAFWVKQDALLGVGAGIAALAICRQWRAWPVWLAVVVALPWSLFVWTEDLPSDFVLKLNDLPLKTAQVMQALWQHAIASGAYALFWPVFLLALALGYRRLRDAELRWLLIAFAIGLLGVFAIYWFSAPALPALLQTSMERVLLTLFVPALLLTALLWPEKHVMAIATIALASFTLFQNTRTWVELRREFAGKTLAQQHVLSVERGLRVQIAGALRKYPDGTHVQVLPKRSLWRHQFYYETYPHLIVDNVATNVIELRLE